MKWKEKFFTLSPVGTADFDPLWCKNFQLRNFGVLHNIMHIMLGTCVPNLKGR
jgi:hypothetical protein